MNAAMPVPKILAPDRPRELISSGQEIIIAPVRAFAALVIDRNISLVLIGRLRDPHLSFRQNPKLAVGMFDHAVGTGHASEARAIFARPYATADEWNWFHMVMPLQAASGAVRPPSFRIDLVVEGSFCYFEKGINTALDLTLTADAEHFLKTARPYAFAWLPFATGPEVPLGPIAEPANLWPDLMDQDLPDTLSAVTARAFALVAMSLANVSPSAPLKSRLAVHLDAITTTLRRMAGGQIPPEKLEAPSFEILLYLAAQHLPADAGRALLRVYDLAAYPSLAATACETILGLATRRHHAWMTRTDFLQEKQGILHDVVALSLPSLRPGPGPSVYLRLKQLEIDHLAQGLPSPDSSAVMSVILAGSQSEPAPDVQPRSILPPRVAMHALPPDIFSQTSLYLAWAAPGLLQRLAAHGGSASAASFGRAVEQCQRLRPTYLVITCVAYPMGGGEAYMHQTCKIMSELGYRVLWVSYVDGATNRPHTASLTCETHYYIEVRRNCEFTEVDVESVICDLAPDLIHTQGTANSVVEPAARRLRVPVMVGYHFWDGLIALGPSGNRNIAKNLPLHGLARLIQPSSTVRYYVASEFMRDMVASLGGPADIAVHHPLPEPPHYQVARGADATFVVQVNICRLKGGAIFHACLKSLDPAIPFLGVQTEACSEELDAEIARAIAGRPGSRFETYGDVRDWYRLARMVIIPTLVDETFCRVAFEAAMNGIPVLCTRNGYLPTMLGEAAIYLDEAPESWIGRIEELYHDTATLAEIGIRQQAHLQAKFGAVSANFLHDALALSALSPRRNIGFFTAWTEQGLGNQMRLYARLLREAGLGTHIFSFQPYAANGKGLTNQQHPAEWAPPAAADSVYYSFNNREAVTSHELEQFTRVHHVGTLVAPEICWQVNWDKLLGLSVPNLMIAAVPNIETIRRDEVPYHNGLTRTWYNTRIAENVLRALGVENGYFIGHGDGMPISNLIVGEKQAQVRTRDHIIYLHVAGHNPDTRKQTASVIAAFALARRHRLDIRLIVTTMFALPPLSSALIDAVQIRTGVLAHSEILALYGMCDVSIQVSSHEGLGLGFYESISCATPVISLDVPPHNEIVQHGQSGWLLPGKAEKLPDNDAAVVMAARLDPADLGHLVSELSREAIASMIETTARLFNERFTETHLLQRLIAALP